ncbi:MAG: hypothetical protein LBR10_12035, partial [Prevotellaceae bacterium]|nr:hypothetical protein [Prevotellaceae bacterium]
MNNIYELFFEIFPALRKIFEYSYIPAKEDFYELTPEQYQKYYREVEKTDEKIFLLLPNHIPSLLSEKEANVVSESEMKWFDKARKLIDAYCEKSGQTFNSLEEKLQYVATFMPPAFTDGTPYQR